MPGPRRTRRRAAAAARRPRQRAIDSPRARSTRRSTTSSSPTRPPLRIDDAGRWNGIVTAPNNRTYDETKQTPTLVMRNDDFGRIARILADGTPVSARVQHRQQVVSRGHTCYNTIGEIAGTDKKDEVVMLGGHLDSWHVATGATDNAIGCAVMMEAARILKALGVQPRRTIRVALWSGEEEGLLGSLAYVEQHFGTVENPKPEFAKFDAYLNVDTRHRQGTRRRRLRSARGGRHPAQCAGAVQGSRRGGRHRRRPAARPAAPTARRSTTPACPASASARIRSTTARTRTTPTSTPTNGSSRTT